MAWSGCYAAWAGAPDEFASPFVSSSLLSPTRGVARSRPAGVVAAYSAGAKLTGVFRTARVAPCSATHSSGLGVGALAP